MSCNRRTLLVFCDSLSYYGPAGGLPADDPRIWPNIVANQLGWDVEVIGRIGWTCRDIWWAATQDPRAWAALPKAGAVIFAKTATPEFCYAGTTPGLGNPHDDTRTPGGSSGGAAVAVASGAGALALDLDRVLGRQIGIVGTGNAGGGSSNGEGGEQEFGLHGGNLSVGR